MQCKDEFKVALECTWLSRFIFSLNDMNCIENERSTVVITFLWGRELTVKMQVLINNHSFVTFSPSGSNRDKCLLASNSHSQAGRDVTSSRHWCYQRNEHLSLVICPNSCIISISHDSGSSYRHLVREQDKFLCCLKTLTQGQKACQTLMSDPSEI